MEPAVQSSRITRGCSLPWWRSYAYQLKEGQLIQYVGIDTFPRATVSSWMSAAQHGGSGANYPSSMPAYMKDNPDITPDDPRGGLFRLTRKRVKASLQRGDGPKEVQ